MHQLNVRAVTAVIVCVLSWAGTGHAVSPGDHAVAGVQDYLQAVQYAQAGEMEMAEQSLLKAISAGYQPFSKMARDPKLAPIRERNTYKAIAAARNAADALLAERRINRWLNRGGYRLVESDIAGIDLVVPTNVTGKNLKKQIARDISAIQSTLFPSPLQQRVLIVLATDTDSWKLFPDSHIHGTYRHELRELVIRELGGPLSHELVHVFHHQNMDSLHQEHPLWFQEGLATLFENYKMNPAGTIEFLPNDRNRIVQYLIDKGQTVKWPAFAKFDDAQFLSRPAEHYAQVRSMFSFVAEKTSLSTWYTNYTIEFDQDSFGISATGQAFTEMEPVWSVWAQEMEFDMAAQPKAMQPVMRTDIRETQQVHVASNSIHSRYMAIRPVQLADYQRAIPALQEVLDQFPDLAAARYDLGLAYVMADQFDMAREQQEQLRELDQNLYNMLGSVLKKRMR